MERLQLEAISKQRLVKTHPTIQTLCVLLWNVQCSHESCQSVKYFPVTIPNPVYSHTHKFDNIIITDLWRVKVVSNGDFTRKREICDFKILLHFNTEITGLNLTTEIDICPAFSALCRLLHTRRHSMADPLSKEFYWTSEGFTILKLVLSWLVMGCISVNAHRRTATLPQKSTDVSKEHIVSIKTERSKNLWRQYCSFSTLWELYIQHRCPPVYIKTMWQWDVNYEIT
jgi:hypothetical protein